MLIFLGCFYKKYFKGDKSMGLNNSLLKEKEIKREINLCDDKGKLLKESIVWARKPVINCNLKRSWLRKKKWNYWCITNEECLFSVTISNIDYAGMVFAYFLDYKSGLFIEKTVISPFGKGCNMPDRVNESVTFDNKNLAISFIQEEDGTKITASCRDFNGFEMSADFKVLYPKGHETLNVVIPWDDKHFQFTSKQQCLPVSGSLTVGSKSYDLTSKKTFGCLDFGRGIWPYKVTWNWGSASGLQNGKTIGLNLGGQWTDGTGMTENAIVIDGKLTKISEDLKFIYDKNNYMNTWEIKSTSTDRIDLSFIPFYERIAKTDLKIVKSEHFKMPEADKKRGSTSAALFVDRTKLF